MSAVHRIRRIVLRGVVRGRCMREGEGVSGTYTMSSLISFSFCFAFRITVRSPIAVLPNAGHAKATQDVVSKARECLEAGREASVAASLELAIAGRAAMDSHACTMNEI